MCFIKPHQCFSLTSQCLLNHINDWGASNLPEAFLHITKILVDQLKDNWFICLFYWTTKFKIEPCVSDPFCQFFLLKFSLLKITQKQYKIIFSHKIQKYKPNNNVSSNLPPKPAASETSAWSTSLLEHYQQNHQNVIFNFKYKTMTKKIINFNSKFLTCFP
jgi:hypothetical protein